MRVQPGSHDNLARLRSGSIHRSHKHPLAIPRIVSSYDSDDDETTEDYDDDDAWDDPKNGSDDDTDAQTVAWLQQMMPSLVAPAPQIYTHLPALMVPPPSLFLTLQRLRC